MKDIKGYEGLYAVDESGKVWSYKRKIFLMPMISPKGYFIVSLCNNGKRKDFSIHRLVADAFIPNPDNLPQINHKDECKTNNAVYNLEWCTAKYNVNYGSRTKRASLSNTGKPFSEERKKRIGQALSKKVLQLSKDGTVINEFSSLAEAEKKTGIWGSNISKCCNNKGLRTAGGYVWKYASEVLI